MSRLSAALSTAIMVAALIASAVSGYAIGTHHDDAPDITVMSCSAWANGATPEIPANTLTDACVDTRGTLHTAPTALEATR